MPDNTRFAIGDTPGPGRYICVSCRECNVVLGDGQQLPPCDNCNVGRHVQYIRVEVITRCGAKCDKSKPH